MMERLTFLGPGSRIVIRYAIGIGAAMSALLLRAALAPELGARYPLALAFAAVLGTAVFCGSGPAVVCALVSAASGYYYLHYQVLPGINSVGLVAYLIGSFIATALVKSIRRERDRLSEYESERRDQAARREREYAVAAQLRAIVESSDDAIVSTGLDGIIATWNHAAERIFGYIAEDALGRPISVLTPEDLAAEEEQFIDRIRAGGRVDTFETVRLHRRGARLDVSLTISPIHDPAGRVSGLSYIARDITERKAFEKRLIEKQKLESLGVLAGGLAHDFNNVLTSIMGNASLVLETMTEAGSRERLRTVLRAAEHAAQLVRQMLAYAGKGAFVVCRLDVSREIEDMEPLIRAAVQARIAIEYRLERELPHIEADASQFRHLVMNLIVNAAESIEDRGAISIATRAAAGGASAILEIRDTGCGMDSSTRERIFEPFFSTKFTGRGLGLAAVMGIIQTCRGEIEVESEPGKGSAFRVIFPAARQETLEANRNL